MAYISSFGDFSIVKFRRLHRIDIPPNDFNLGRLRLVASGLINLVARDRKFVN